MGRYVALLRGINVGGKNLIKMIALKACFEEHGFRDVVTYIQSGNVLFDAKEAGAAALTRRLESMLSAGFDYQASVVVRSAKQLQAVVDERPAGFGASPAKYRYDVAFLKAPLTATAAAEMMPAREGVDQVWAGPGVVYYARLVARATESKLSRVVAMPIYQSMTVRNWNTTTKLLAMMNA